MTIIIALKFIHYLAIVFSGGVLVGGGVIQSVYAKENQIPDFISKDNEITCLIFFFQINYIINTYK